MIRMFLAFALVLTMPHAFAQHHTPYAQMKDRAIKALSDQQIADLKAGRGMGLALPAELNGYPGPMHVLELADAMRLSAEQRRQTANLIDSMKSEAMPLGEKLIDGEAALERLFANREITPETLGHATQDIATLQGQLREAHLKYHLAMVELLTPQQVTRYRELRGYQPAGAAQPHHRRHHRAPGTHNCPISIYNILSACRMNIGGV
jgi:hypothetical protein